MVDLLALQMNRHTVLYYLVETFESRLLCWIYPPLYQVKKQLNPLAAYTLLPSLKTPRETDQ